MATIVSDLIITAYVAVAIGVAWVLLSWRQSRTSTPLESGQIRLIRICGTYQPSEVHIRAGAPARLIFRREETAPCSERVVFPDYGISVTLPPFEDIIVDLPASEPGEHEFTCQLQMLRGRLVIDPNPAA